MQNTYTGKSLVGIPPIEMVLTFIEIYPESMSDSNILEKKSVISWVEENMKSCQIHGSLNRLVRKKNPAFKGCRS